MTQYKSDFLNILTERGFVHQCSDFEGLDKKLTEGVQSAYIGFDATAKSLHIGNLTGIMMLYWFQQSGHKPITLMGGGTSKIGDPSFKDDQRVLLDDKTIKTNIKHIQNTCFKQFLEYEDDDYVPKYKKPHHKVTQKFHDYKNHYFHSINEKYLYNPRTYDETYKDIYNTIMPQNSKALMVNNNDWLDGLKYLSFLRDYGRHFTVNRMLSFDSVKQRLERESPLSLLEFNYMVMQGYDFLELHRRHGTILQMGGSDQWGNIINGVDLGHKSDRVQLFALTAPLLTTPDGVKMGKTVGGAVWLNKDMLSPYDYYQYWRNVDDVMVGTLLKRFTTLPIQEINKLEALKGSEINDAKKILAFEATKICHGEKAAIEARDTAQKVFEQGGVGGDLPSITIPKSRLEGGVSVVDLLVESGLAASKSEARRLIQGGGARINDNAINDTELKAGANDMTRDGYIKLSAGKKKHALVKT